MDLDLTADDIGNAIKAIEGTAYTGKDAPAVAAMLGRYRAALAAFRKPAAPSLVAPPGGIRLPSGDEAKTAAKTGTEG